MLAKQVSEYQINFCAKATKSKSKFAERVIIPRYTSPNRGSCVQLQSCDRQVNLTTKLKPTIQNVAFIGAYPEYYLSMLPDLNAVKEVFFLDGSLDLLNRTQCNVQRIAYSKEKYYMLTNYNNWDLEEEMFDQIVVNDNMNLIMSDDLDKTVDSLIGSLKKGGVLAGAINSEDGANEIKDSIEKDNSRTLEVEEVSLNQNYTNTLFLYNHVKAS